MIEDRDDSRGVGAPAGPSRRLEACQSPVWDTALAIDRAQRRRRRPPTIRRSCAPPSGCSARRSRVRGDWAVAQAALAPGGWAFEFANDNYPDVDDTAEVVLALRARAGARARRRHARAAARDATRVGAGERWVEGMQSADGGWGAFDADNTRALVRELPFLDFGEVIDEPSADVTAHASRCSPRSGSPTRRAARRGVRWLIDAAGARRLVVRALGRQPRLRHRRGACRRWSPPGVRPSDACIRRAVRWLERAPERGRRLGRGPALLRRSRVDRPRPEHRLADRLGAARAARRRASAREALRRGVDWLVATQRAGRDAGTSRSTPAPASPPTTTSTTTSTGSTFPDHGARPLPARRPRG